MIMEMLHSHKFCILFLSIILTVLCCCLSVSAAENEIQQSTDEVVITEQEDLGVSILNDETSTETTIETSDNTVLLENINTHLTYVTGILVFFTVVVLLYFAYKFFALFF